TTTPQSRHRSRRQQPRGGALPLAKGFHFTSRGRDRGGGRIRVLAGRPGNAQARRTRPNSGPAGRSGRTPSHLRRVPLDRNHEQVDAVAPVPARSRPLPALPVVPALSRSLPAVPARSRRSRRSRSFPSLELPSAFPV